MPTSSPFLFLAAKAGLLLLTFVGAGLYLRGFWVYFRTVRWLWYPSQALLRRRYRSSAIAALLREPDLLPAKRQFLLALLGLPLFAVGGATFNVLQKLGM